MNAVSTNPNFTAAAIGRVLLAVIFLVSGLGKLADPGGTQGYIAAMGLPLPVLGYAAALAVEFIGGAFLLLGFHARAAALVLAVYSVLTALVFHHAFADQNQLFHFLKNFAIAGGLLQVVAFDAGAYSVTRWLSARGASSTLHQP